MTTRSVLLPCPQVSEQALLSNLDLLSSLRPRFPLDIVQLDDGFQPAWGDWYRTNDRFPSGLGTLSQRIQERGLVPGLWLAPLAADKHSRCAADSV